MSTASIIIGAIWTGLAIIVYSGALVSAWWAQIWILGAVPYPAATIIGAGVVTAWILRTQITHKRMDG